jgi:hypothetical protein
MELLIGGAFILFYLGITVACVLWALSWAGRRKCGVSRKSAVVVLVLFIAYAIPFGDHTIGYVYFNRLCDSEAGARIYRTASGVEGLLSPTADGQMARHLGYHFVEEGTDTNNVTRYEIRGDDIVEHKNTSSVSRYILEHRHTDGKLGVATGKYVISDESTKEELAVYTNFSYRGGWLSRGLLSGYGGISASCPNQVFDFEKFIVAVLKPSQASN